jgi:Flp pilus assembly protein TadG
MPRPLSRWVVHGVRRLAGRRLWPAWLLAEQGQALVFAAGALVVLLGCLGLAVDWGYAALRYRQAQNAADAAALAAAQRIAAGDEQANATARGLLVVHRHQFEPTDLKLAYLDSDGDGTTDRVRAIVQDTFDTFFMHLLLIRTSTVGATATARVAGAVPCALCVLRPTGPGTLTLSGGGDIEVSGGGVAVNSGHSRAASLSGGGTIIASPIDIVGGYQTSGGSSFDRPPTTGVAPVPDPLASVPVPTCPPGAPVNVTVPGGTTRTISPGTYGQIDVSAGGTLVLNPGVYCITGQFKMSSGASTKGSGVMLYFPPGGSYDQSGNSRLLLSAPASGPYRGLLLFYDRQNEAELKMSGNGGMPYTGTVYAKSGDLILSGGASAIQLNSLVVVGTLAISGSGDIDLAFDPALSGRAGSPSLVE